MLIIRRVIIGSWGLISDVDHKALWGFPTYHLTLCKENAPKRIVGPTPREGDLLYRTRTTLSTSQWCKPIPVQ